MLKRTSNLSPFTLIWTEFLLPNPPPHMTSNNLASSPILIPPSPHPTSISFAAHPSLVLMPRHYIPSDLTHLYSYNSAIHDCLHHYNPRFFLAHSLTLVLVFSPRQPHKAVVRN